MKRVTFVVALVAVVAACGSSRSASTTKSAAHTSTSTTSSRLALSLTVEEQAQRDHPAKPLPFPDMSGVIDPKLVLHRSGGPYLTSRQASEIALSALQCGLGRPTLDDPKKLCLEADVSFFDRYADFWAVEGGQTQFVGGWGPDREMFVVTIFGDLPLVTTTDVAQVGPLYAPWRTFQMDATTGRILMTGGLPLPERLPGIETFRAASPIPTAP